MPMLRYRIRSVGQSHRSSQDLHDLSVSSHEADNSRTPIYRIVEPTIALTENADTELSMWQRN